MAPREYGTIKITMHSDGCYFDGNYTDDITEQAQHAYLEIAEVVARYIGDSAACVEILEDFKALNKRNREGR